MPSLKAARPACSPPNVSKAQGSSEVLLGGVVTYHPDAKQRLLGVKRNPGTVLGRVAAGDQ
ncbi:MAG: CinA family protein [Hymenobacter sp.]